MWMDGTEGNEQRKKINKFKIPELGYEKKNFGYNQNGYLSPFVFFNFIYADINSVETKEK